MCHFSLLPKSKIGGTRQGTPLLRSSTSLTARPFHGARMLAVTSPGTNIVRGRDGSGKEHPTYRRLLQLQFTLTMQSSVKFLLFGTWATASSPDQAESLIQVIAASHAAP